MFNENADARKKLVNTNIVLMILIAKNLICFLKTLKMLKKGVEINSKSK